MRLIREAYRELKYRLGRIPSLLDFDTYGSVDVTKIFDSKLFGSYYTFLRKCDDKNYSIILSEEEVLSIEYISKKLAKGKRPHELEMLRCIVIGCRDLLRSFRKNMKKNYDIEVSDEEEISVLRNLTLDFLMPKERENFDGCSFLEISDDGIWQSSESFKQMLASKNFRNMIEEIIEFGLSRYKEYFSRRYKDTNMQLYQKYTYEDICRMLNWENQMNPLNVGGYFYERKTKTMPVFINYEKEHGQVSYEHCFLSNKELIAFSKHPRRVTSSDADHIYKRTREDLGNRIYLFVRKNKNDKEAKEFYFLGEIEAAGEPKQVILEKSGDEAFEITYILSDPVREDIYEYIVED